MARTSWNLNSPDVIGVEFLGMGHVGYSITNAGNARALKFTAQRSGEVDEIAVYSGPNTKNSVLSGSQWVNHRLPYIIELYPVSGIPATNYSITDMPGTMTTSSNVVDETLTAVENNELAAANDGLLLYQSANYASATVHFPGVSTWALTDRIFSLGLQVRFQKQARVRRIDQNSTTLWNKLVGSGGQSLTYFMGEAFIESGSTTEWHLWTPTFLRQFASSIGNRRLKVEGIQANQGYLDLLGLRVHHQTETRAGVGVLETNTKNSWIEVPFHAPAATGTAATVTSGVEYALVVRRPQGIYDYGNPTATFDLRAVPNRKANSSFISFSDLDWKLYSTTNWGVTYDYSFKNTDIEQDGLAAIYLLNNNDRTVDSQPYERALGARVYDGQNAAMTALAPNAASVYGEVRYSVSGSMSPNAPLLVQVDQTGGATQAGPITVTAQDIEESPIVGTDESGNIYHEMRTSLGGAFTLPASVDVIFSSNAVSSAPWLIGDLVAKSPPGSTTNQTFGGSGTDATGQYVYPPTGSTLSMTAGEHDLEVVLLAAAPTVTGVGVEILQQPVTGAATCDPCGDIASECTITSIPYAQVCWGQSSLQSENFRFYEVQRKEEDGDWKTVAFITSISELCWDDWSAPFETAVTYRIRQQRADETYSDWSIEVTTTINLPSAGDIFITSPDDPSLNVVFIQDHGASLPVEKDWDFLDSDQFIYRPIYGRDNYLAFRPLEKLGVQYKRRLLLSALCTPEEPCIGVAQGLRDITAASVSYLVVRDRCQHRFYASVRALSATQLTDPSLGDIWTADIEVTELAEPMFTVEHVTADLEENPPQILWQWDNPAMVWDDGTMIWS